MRSTLVCPRCEHPVPLGVNMPAYSPVHRVTCPACGLMTLQDELLRRTNFDVLRGGGGQAPGGVVSDLTIDGTGGNALLTFTLPGFSGALPGFYDARHAPVIIDTEAVWAAATIIDGPWSPMVNQAAWTPVGSTHQLFDMAVYVPGLTFFSIRFKSSGGLVGPLSNSPAFNYP